MDQIKKEYLKLNKNLVLSFILSASVSAAIAQSLADQEYYLNATYTIIFGYVAFFAIFGTLFYLDSRKKFLTKIQQNKNFKKEIIRLITSLSIGEIFYFGVRWTTHYYFLNVGFEPYLASLTSESISMGLYMLVVTVSAKLTGLFKEF